MSTGTLYFFCGKMGAGKSTMARKVAAKKNAVLISEDEWLAQLYPGEIKTFEDYLEYSRRLRPLVESHVGELLKKGSSVVMDYAANTRRQRDWLRSLAENAGAPFEFFYIEKSDEECLRQIAKRRVEEPGRAGFDTEEVFRNVTRFFEEPDENEVTSVANT